MKVVGGDRDVSRAVELQAVLVALREGDHALVVTDGDERQRLYRLEAGDQRLTLGRAPECDVVLDWDRRVSRVHAEVERLGGGWVVADDGLSQNGTFVGEERVSGRRRLRDGDAIRCGATVLLYRTPEAAAGEMTAVASGKHVLTSVTPMQRKVLIALCRPMREEHRFAVPATNGQIAAELVLSVDAVKTHLRALYERLELDDLPQNEKRVRLAEFALRSGVIGPRDLDEA
jgi:predicted component of type VI protein secretion system